MAESTVVRSLHGQRQSTTKWQRRRKGNWIRSQPDEHLIGTEQGIRRCRTIWRRPENKRWDRKLFDNFKGTPWQPRGGPTAVPGAPATPGLPAPGTPAGSNRGVYITLGLQLKHGQTPDCPGCYTPPSTIPVRTARCVGRDLKSWWPKNKEESGAAGGPAVPELEAGGSAERAAGSTAAQGVGITTPQGAGSTAPRDAGRTAPMDAQSGG